LVKVGTKAMDDADGRRRRRERTRRRRAQGLLCVDEADMMSD
jgi:hypothetical protein